MTPQHSPPGYRSDIAFSHQSCDDGAHDPQPDFHFGEMQIGDLSMNEEFVPMHYMQQAFGGAKEGASDFQMNWFSSQNNASGFGQYQQMLQQAEKTASTWPNGGSVAVIEYVRTPGGNDNSRFLYRLPFGSIFPTLRTR
nr:hypothetical protein B0A51_14031 [Rachicladosporium sp. CCFEE 5018]